MISIPGTYYLESRYHSNLYYFLLYICKYWGTIALFYLITFNSSFEFEFAVLCLLSLLLYFSVYDYFCFVNDQEPDALSYRTGGFVSKTKVFCQTSFLSVIGLITFGNLFITPILICFLISCIFYIHNNIPEKTRVITYFILYLIKPFLFFQTTDAQFLPVFVFAIFYAFSYIPYYSFRKFRLIWPNRMVKFFLSGIVLKVIFLLFFLSYDTSLIYIIFFQVVLTALDFFMKRNFINNR